jgi:hypothetical protein
VVGLQDDGGLRPQRVEARPRVAGGRRRRERVEHDADAARLDRERRDVRLPVRPFLPVGMRLAPQPQAGRDVADLDGHPLMATIRSIGTRARSAIASGTLTSCRIPRRLSRSLGSVIIFM